MSARIFCPACRGIFQVPADAPEGPVGRCPHCGHLLEIQATPGRTALSTTNLVRETGGPTVEEAAPAQEGVRCICPACLLAFQLYDYVGGEARCPDCGTAIPTPGAEAAPQPRPCPWCGVLVLAEGGRCPECGSLFPAPVDDRDPPRPPREAPRQRRALPRWAWVAMGGGAGFLVLVIVLALRGRPAGKPAQGQELAGAPAQGEAAGSAIRVQARDLAVQAGENVPAFRARWSGQWVEIEDSVGPVTDQPPWDTGGARVRLASAPVYCTFSDPSIAPSLRRGQPIRVAGQADLDLGGSPVLLRHCRLK